MLPLPDPIDDRLRQGGEELTVLVVRLGAMGDILRTLPPVRFLRRALPRSSLQWVVDDRWKTLLEGDPDLDDLVVVPRGEWRRLRARPGGWPRLSGSVLAFRRRLRDSRADLLLDFHGNLRSGCIAWWSGAPVRVGYAGHQQKEGNHWFTTHRVASGARRASRMERNLSLVRALGILAPEPREAGLPLARAGRAEADRILGSCGASDPDRVVLVSPGASESQAYKKPPADLLVAASRRVGERGLVPLAVWGPGEERDARLVVDRAGGVAVLAPRTTLPVLAALLERGRLFVGGDSGPLHMACACGCPVLGLYGPTDPEVNRPWGVPFRALHPPGRRYTGIKKRDRAGGGFEGLTPERVERAVDELLDETARGSRSTSPAQTVDG